MYLYYFIVFMIIIIYYIYTYSTFCVPVFANYTTGFCVIAHRLWYLVSSYTRQDRTVLAALPLSLITGKTRLLVRDPLAHISKHLYTCTWEATVDTSTHTVTQSRQSVCVCVCVTDDCTSGTCKLTQTHSERTQCV